MNVIELMLPPFVACVLLVVVHAYLGLHVIAREVIFVDISLAQMAALGTTAGLLMGIDPRSMTAQLLALATVMLGAAIFAFTRSRRREGVPQEAIIGIVYVVASAAAILMASRAAQGGEHIKEILEGTVLWVTWSTIARLAAAYAVLGALLFALRRKFETISFEPDQALARGVNVRWWDFWFYLLFGIVITFSVPIGGVPLVFSFLIVPAVTAFLFTRRALPLTLISWSTGVVASAVGLGVSYWKDLPTGPVIVCTLGLALIVAAVVKRLVASPAEALEASRASAPAASTETASP